MRPFLEATSSILAGGLDPLVANTLRAALLIAIAALATLALRRAPAATRHLVWTLALVGCVTMPVASWLLPGWSLPALPAWTARDEARNDLRAEAPAVSSDTRQGSRAVADPSEPARSSLSGSSPAPDPAPVASPPPAFATIVRAAVSALPVLWLAGMILMLARHGMAWHRSSRLARHALPVTDAGWTDALARNGEKLDLRRLPSLKASAEISVPIVLGSLRPTILLPLHAIAWRGERRDAVLLHELAHVRRLDLVTVRAAQLASALYWFHPLVWHATRAQRSEAERACDDLVLNAGPRASAYASDLLEIAEATRREHFGSAVFAMARRTQLEHRLLAILDPAQARGAAGRVAIVLSLLVSAGSIGAIAAARPAGSAGVAEPAAEARTVSPLAIPAAPPVVEPPVEAAAGSPPAAPGPSEAPAFMGPVAEAVTADPPATMVEPAASRPTGAGVDAGQIADAVMVLAEAAAGKNESSYGVIDAGDGKGEQMRNNWNRPESRGSFKTSGIIRYNDELTDLASISPGGSVHIEEQRDGHLHKASFRPRAGGVDRSYSIDGQPRAWDDDARAWLARLLIECDRGSGMFANHRFPRLMREGGPTRVLREVSLMSSDYGRAVYFLKLLDVRLDEPTMERVVAQAGREIGSDYELARTLITAAEKHALENARTRSAFLAALESVESDYEHARVLIILVSRRDLSAGVAEGALASTLRIGSDYERARVLITMVEHGNVRPASQRSFFQRVQSMGSDYEQARVLRAFLSRGTLSADNVGGVLDASAAIDSDYECANVLVELAQSVRLDDRGRAAFVSASERIGSDYERNRALAALGRSSSE